MSGSTQAHSALMAVIVDYLHARRAWVYRVHGHLGGARGAPDCLAILPPSGRLVAIEGKTGRGTQSATQRQFQEAIERAGGLYILARQVDDVEAALLAAGLVDGKVLWPKREGQR